MIVRVYTPGSVRGIVWDYEPPRSEVTSDDQARLSVLVQELNKLEQVPPGPRFCPRDDGSHVTLTFFYGGDSTRTVDVKLSGCRFVLGEAETAWFATRELYAAIDALFD